MSIEIHKKKHQYAIRVMGKSSNLPMEILALHETDNNPITLDDFIEINKSDQYALICYFYIGFMTKDEVLEKYNMGFILLCPHY